MAKNVVAPGGAHIQVPDMDDHTALTKRVAALEALVAQLLNQPPQDDPPADPPAPPVD